MQSSHPLFDLSLFFSDSQHHGFLAYLVFIFSENMVISFQSSFSAFFCHFSYTKWFRYIFVFDLSSLLAPFMSLNILLLVTLSFLSKDSVNEIASVLYNVADLITALNIISFSPNPTFFSPMIPNNFFQCCPPGWILQSISLLTFLSFWIVVSFNF